jgi:hypothetical protein
MLGLVAIGLLLTVPLYVGLAASGVIRSPFFPRADGDIALARSDKPGLRVLFIGNSFTYFNSMPATIGRLAKADKGAPRVFVVEYAAPNWRLSRAAKNTDLIKMIGEVPWNAVVLQDSSSALSTPDFLARETYPATLFLNREIEVRGAETVLFLTWGYKKGDRRISGDSFEAMEGRLERGADELASTLGAEVAPVGPAWAEGIRRRPGLNLWKRDGRHPNSTGSYLAACVFYGFLTGRPPTGSSYVGHLDPALARFLQGVAADVLETYRT